MKRILLLMAIAATLPGCTAFNAYTGAAINAGEASSAGAIQNIKAIDDAKYTGWVQAACAMPIGALQRNNTGNAQANQAILTACPIPGVAVVNAASGSITMMSLGATSAPTLTPGFTSPKK